jgi:ATPase family associated with various cellular activities (AAA)
LTDLPAKEGQAMQRSDYLALWRRKLPRELRKEATLPEDLAAFIAARLRPKDDAERALLDEFVRAGINRREAALALASRCAAGVSRQPTDLAMTCALFAALESSEAAAVILAQTLRDRADDFSKRLSRMRRREGGLAVAMRRHAIWCWRAALAWTDEVNVAFLREPQFWADAFKAIGSPITLRHLKSSETLASREVKGASLIVVTKIDLAGSDGAEFGDDYRRLTKPLPLRGGHIEPRRLRQQLIAEFPHFEAAIERIVGDLQLRRRAGARWARFRPILLVGPPGIGKTRFAKQLAQLLDTGYGEVAGSGSSDDRALRGTARGWRSAQPALPLLVMLRCFCANPVMLVDEIDKAGGSEHNWDVRRTLLSMLESETARAWFDEALLAPADLSQVSWILTANDASGLSASLLSRVAMVKAPPPLPETFDALLGSLLHSIAEELGVASRALPPLSERAREELRRAFVEKPDLRRVKRAIESALSAGAWPRSRNSRARTAPPRQ